MFINTKENYIEIGTSINEDNTLNNSLKLPAPVDLPSGNEFLADAGRNGDGVMLIQLIGRTQYTTSIKWASLPNKKWWEINRWFETYGYVFFMKYFSHTEGRVKIQRFYRGNMEKGVPSSETENIGGYLVPKRYKNCGFNIIDMGETGEDELKILYEVNLL